MKPYVICHMVSSVDGRILASQWPRQGVGMGLFERFQELLGGDAWLVGRVTGQEYAKAKAYPDHTGHTYPREPWFARRDAEAYGCRARHARQDRLGALRRRRPFDRSRADGTGLGRPPSGTPQRWCLLHLRRRTGPGPVMTLQSSVVLDGGAV